MAIRRKVEGKSRTRKAVAKYFQVHRNTIRDWHSRVKDGHSLNTEIAGEGAL